MFSIDTASAALRVWMESERYPASAWEPAADGGAYTFDPAGNLVQYVSPLMLRMGARLAERRQREQED